jgi:hypothetical protein
METNAIRHYQTGYIQSLCKLNSAGEIIEHWQKLTPEQKSLIPSSVLEKYVNILIETHVNV